MILVEIPEIYPATTPNTYRTIWVDPVRVLHLTESRSNHKVATLITFRNGTRLTTDQPLGVVAELLNKYRSGH